MVLVIVGGLLALLALYAGVLGLLAGLGYLTATLVEARKSRQVTLSTTPEMGNTSS